MKYLTDLSRIVFPTRAAIVERDPLAGCCRILLSADVIENFYIRGSGVEVTIPARMLRARDTNGIIRLLEAHKETLEKETEPMGPHDIGWAVRQMRAGHKVQREGWNGKGMYLVLQKAYPDGIPINANTAEATGLTQGTMCRFLPYVMMRTADGAFVPWLCSQTDLLAEDWQTPV